VPNLADAFAAVAADALNRAPSTRHRSHAMPKLALLLSLALAPLLAQAAHPLVGRWAVTLSVGSRIENGEETAIMQPGTLSVSAQGDSLIAMLKITPPEGMTERPARRMAAKQTAGPVVFTFTSQATLNINGEESVRSATSTFSLSASGDVLRGTVQREVEGAMASAGPQPVSGTRVKP
jgi:hypothetical protein